MTAEREQAIRSLVDALRAAYPTRGFKIHPALSFATVSHGGKDHNSTKGIGATVTRPVEADEILLVVPGSSRLALWNDKDFVDVQLTSSSSAGGGSSSTPLTLTKFVNDVQQKAAKILQTGQAFFEAKDVGLVVMAMYAVAAAASPDEKNDTTMLCVKQVATWPSMEEAAEQDPLFWDQSTVDIMKHTYAYEIVTSVQEKTREVFESVLWPMLERKQVAQHFIPRAETGDGSNTNDTSKTLKQQAWEAFQYAFSMVFSRAHGSDLPAIIPLIDLFNGLTDCCGDQVNVAMANGKWPFIKGAMFRDECNLPCSCVYARRKLEPGEELIISYGDVTPNSFLLKYGFIPPQLLKGKSSKAEPVVLWYPPALAPAPDDIPRVQALQKQGFPTSPEDVRVHLSIQLLPESLEAYSSVIAGGLGRPVQCPYTLNEDKGLGSLRHFGYIAQLLGDDDVQTNLHTGRLCSSSIQMKDAGSLMVQIVDFNLNRLSSQDSDDEQESARMAIRAKESHIGTLARWRHILARRYGIPSFMDREEEISLPSSHIASAAPPKPSVLGDKGCPICGRRIGLKACSRCRKQCYCCREHQVLDRKFHKQVCCPYE